MEASASAHTRRNLFDRRPVVKPEASPPVKWVKEWVTQDIASGGKCRLLKWVSEATLKAIEEKKPPELPEPEPEPTTEVLFLCSSEGCGRTFMDAGALRKHSQIHGPRQYYCVYENCGRKFLDRSKLKRHLLVHTGKREFECPFPGCGKAFSLDFNLKSHMKTHSQENYFVCHYPGCGRRFAQDSKLRNHIASQHVKALNEVQIQIPLYNNSPVIPDLKLVKTPKSSTVTHNSPALDRPFVCPYESCGNRAYIHAYKLNLHLKSVHPGHHFKDGTQAKANAKSTVAGRYVDTEASHDDDGAARAVNPGNGKMLQKQNRAKPILKSPPAKIAPQLKSSNGNSIATGKSRLMNGAFDEGDDSEETEDEKEELEDKWGYHGNGDDDDDDEETDYED